MKFNYIDTLFALSYALDCVEEDLLGATTEHGKRVAYLSCRMGREMGLNSYQLQDLTACAIMHDSALTQFVQKMWESEISEADMIRFHCVEGEENMRHMLSYDDIGGAVLYHHEYADGMGLMGKTFQEVSLYSRIIHLTDQIDVTFDLSKMTGQKQEGLQRFLTEQENHLFDEICVKCFRKAVQPEQLWQLKRGHMNELLHQEFPSADIECDEGQFIELASIFAKIIDYKSPFTSAHSIGIAEKAAKMGAYYQMDQETIAKLYMAGALHDIGKLSIHHEVLEKPGKLTAQEYQYIQTHAYHTYLILSEIKGFEDICSWASMHHEKLDGTGYPFGKTAKDLGKLERLMACLDIYQALTERRPYKERMSHEQAIEILKKMVQSGKLDREITEDLNRVFTS